MEYQIGGLSFHYVFVQFMCAYAHVCMCDMVCVCVCVCGLLRIRERGERRSILVFLIYPTTVYCQSCFLKYVFVQRNQILLKIKLRSPSSFTVWAHSSHKESAGSKFVNILLWNPLEESAAIWKLCVSVSIKRAQVKVKNFLNFLDSVRERNTKT